MLPLFLRLAGKPILVVGAGEVARRKIEDLVAEGAVVRVVAPRAVAAVHALAADGRISLAVRPFEPADVSGVWLVVAATDDPAVQAAVATAAEDARLFCLAIDDPSNGSAISASVIRRGPLVAAISTSGEAPALARLLREVLEDALPEDRWVEAARALRDRWRADGTPMGSRFAELLRSFRARAEKE